MLHFFAIFAQNYLNTLMEQYIVSARKYRPTTFKTVVGQKSLTTTLKNAIDSDRLAQAYLFCGPRGVGKTSCARIFAKTINCLNPTTEGDACNECESCRAFNEGRSFNIIELDAASNNSVDDIRGLTDQVRIPPQIGKYRVFIIDEVHMLSVAAFNAFLKTLEEPPKYVIFILATTEKHKVIPTILSRCQIYDFNRITINDMVEHLAYVASAEGISAEPAALNVIAQKADGAMRDALSIFDQVAASSMNNITYQSAIDNLNVLDYDYYFKLVDMFISGDVASTLLIYKEIRDKGFDSLFFVNGLGNHIRDLMVAKDRRTISLLEVSDEVSQNYIAQASAIQPKWFYQAMDLCNSCDLNYRTSTNKQFLVELMLIKMCQLNHPSDSTTSNENADKSSLKQESVQKRSSSSPQQEEAPQQYKSNTSVEKTSENEAAINKILGISTPRKIDTPDTQQQKTTISRPTTLSITNAIKKPADKTAEANTTLRRQPFTRSDLMDYWVQFISRHPEMHILINSMRTANPMQLNEETYKIIVENPAQKSAFDNSMSQLMSFLRDGLKNDMLTIEVEVSKTDDRPKMSSPQDLLKKIVDKNENIKELLIDIDAELVI